MILDTHAFYWLVSGVEALDDQALLTIGRSQEIGRLFVSAITAWELSLAAQKPPYRNPPQLSSTMSIWFRAAVRATSARVIGINERIAIEAAEVPAATGHKDPGDCYLIATARLRKLPLVTRDLVLRDLATSGYVDVVVC